MKENIRELVLESILAITQKGEYSHIVIKNVLDKHDYLDSKDKAFFKRVCEGTLERMLQLDYVINQFSKVKVSKMKPVILGILRMSVYQILFMDKVPDSAVCNEAVKLAQRKSFQSLKGFVNGVLRNIARSKESIEYPKREDDLLSFLSITYAMPLWIVELFVEERGASQAEEILKGLLEKRPVTIRINQNMPETKQKAYVEELKEKGIIASQHPYLSYAYLLNGVEGLHQVPGFLEGQCSVQDISSMLVGEIAGITGNENIIDVCAAPGGKALHAAEKLGSSGEVDARDISEKKIALIEENQKRMRMTNMHVSKIDAAKRDEKSIAAADIVLADVPCSGLGVIGKKGDIKYHITKQMTKDIVTLQKEIVTTVQEYVKPGGILIYSTCTIHKKENEDMFQWITENFDFTPEHITPYLPSELHTASAKEGYLQLLPGIHPTDGFFMAKFRKGMEGSI